MNDTVIKILVGNKVIGAIQSVSFETDCCPIAISSSREIIERDVYPRVQTSRMRFDRLKVVEAFSRGFVNANSRCYPFDIHVEEPEKSTLIKNAWIESNSVSKTFETSDWVITEDVSLLVESITETKK